MFEQIIWSYWPIWGAPALTGVLAYLHGQPWDVFFLMVLGTALMAVMLLYFGGQWRAAQTTENKIRFGVPVFGVVAPDKSMVPSVMSIQLGISIDNIAQFPMEVTIEDVRVRIEDRQPQDSHQRKTVPVEVQGQIFHRASGVTIRDLIQPNKSFEGDFYCKIKYGRPGKLNREKETAYAVLFKFDDKMELQQPSITPVDPADYLQGKGRVAWKIPES